jgi:hypothetical protein
VSEEPFEIPGSSTHPSSNAPHEARINRKLQVGFIDLMTMMMMMMIVAMRRPQEGNQPHLLFSTKKDSRHSFHTK